MYIFKKCTFLNTSNCMVPVRKGYMSKEGKKGNKTGVVGGWWVVRGGT